MRLIRATIENFRCYRDPFTIEFNELTAILGRNDQGKSAILEALDGFFNEQGLDKGDIPIGSLDDKICISCEFADPPAQVVLDSSNITTLAAEHLLSQQGTLVIKKVFSQVKMKCTGVFAVAHYPTTQEANDLHTLKISALRARATQLGVDLAGVNATIKAELRSAIWNSFNDLAKDSIEVELKAEDAKLIWEDINKAMPIYSLFKSDRKSSDQDVEAQDPMKMAVKEALSELQTTLDGITQSVKEEVEAVARATVEKLRDINPTLASQLNPEVKTDAFEKLFKISLTDDNQIPVDKRGSGVRRLILLSFFQAKVQREAEKAGLDEDSRRSVIMAFEEPETSQHPDHQMLLLDAFQDLTTLGHQIILTTHTPALARRLPKPSIRFLDCDANSCRFLLDGTDADVFMHVGKSLGVQPDTSVRLFFGVEGKNDINFWRSISAMLIRHGEIVPNLDQLERDGAIMFIPLGGSNLQILVNRLGGLNIPEIHVFDRDAAPGQPAKYQADADEVNRRANARSFISYGREAENYIHPAVINSNYGFQAIARIDPIQDVPNLVAEAVYLQGNNLTPWADLPAEKIKKREGKVKSRINGQCVLAMTPVQLDACDTTGWVRGVLRCVQSVLDGDLSVLN